MKYLLDTHTWIWWNAEPDRLSKEVIQVIRDSDGYDELLLSAISVWEFCKLLEKEKIGLSCAAEDWIKEALDIPKLRLVQLTPRISYQSTVLPGTFHQDPVDQIIVATAREENGVILTKDRLISQYPHVKTTW